MDDNVFKGAHSERLQSLLQSLSDVDVTAVRIGKLVTEKGEPCSILMELNVKKGLPHRGLTHVVIGSDYVVTSHCGEGKLGDFVSANFEPLSNEEVGVTEKDTDTMRRVIREAYELHKDVLPIK